MELLFLGTSAGVPTRERNVTAIALLPGVAQQGWWLFDCGEATQHQMLSSPLHPGKIEKIFITHLHGDHIFGLPGLLCSRSMSGIAAPLTIYGPAGIKEYVEVNLRLSGSWTGFPLEIIEITPGEIFDDGSVKITAAPLSHPVPSFGYRIAQYDKPGALDAAGLKAAGVPSGPQFQALKRGESITLIDGRIIHGKDWLGPATPGKTLVIFGDTGPCESALALARGGRCHCP